MKKKLLSFLIIGGLFAGMGLSAECFAAPGHHRDIKSIQHKELRHRQAHKKPVGDAHKKHAKKAPAKKHQVIKKHQQSRFKAQKQHKKNIKRAEKNNRKNIKNENNNNRHNRFFHKFFNRR